MTASVDGETSGTLGTLDYHGAGLRQSNTVAKSRAVIRTSVGADCYQSVEGTKAYCCLGASGYSFLCFRKHVL